MSRVLIVESNSRLAKVIVVSLRQQGLDCLAETSQEGAEKIMKSGVSFAAIFVSDSLQEVPFSVASREISHSFIDYLREIKYGGKVVHCFDKKGYPETEVTFPFILIEIQKEGEETDYLGKCIRALSLAEKDN